MWISLAVPLAVLLAAMLLQRLEATLLTAPEADEHTNDPAASPLARPHPPPEPVAPRRRPPRPSGARPARAPA